MLPERKRHEIDRLVEATIITSRANGAQPAESIFAVARNCGYRLHEYSDLTLEKIEAICAKYGGTLPPGMFFETTKGEKFIFYNNLLSINEVSYTIAHELGHGQMGHVEPSSLAERETDYFADCILSKLPDVRPVKPEYAAGTLGRFINIGTVAAVLLGAACIHYICKKSWNAA